MNEVLKYQRVGDVPVESTLDEVKRNGFAIIRGLLDSNNIRNGVENFKTRFSLEMDNPTSGIKRNSRGKRIFR